MTYFRNSKLIERYEDVIFHLQTAMNMTLVNAAPQTRTDYRFIVDNSGESTPFDWYHARFDINFKLQKLADGANIGNQEGMVNSAFSFIKKIEY